MNAFVRALSSLLLLAITACGGGSGGSNPSSFSLISSANADPDVVHVLLGGIVNHGAIWETSGDTYWHEVGSSNYHDGAGNWFVYDNGPFRVKKSVTDPTPLEVTTFLHIRSGTGGCSGRLYNKIRIVRVLPTFSDQIVVDSEALAELASGCFRFFDASRTVTGVDMSPVPNAQNVYAVEIVAGDGTHTEVSYGSNNRVRVFQ